MSLLRIKFFKTMTLFNYCNWLCLWQWNHKVRIIIIDECMVWMNEYTYILGMAKGGYSKTPLELKILETPPLEKFWNTPPLIRREADLVKSIRHVWEFIDTPYNLLRNLKSPIPSSGYLTPPLVLCCLVTCFQ